MADEVKRLGSALGGGYLYLIIEDAALLQAVIDEARTEFGKSDRLEKAFSALDARLAELDRNK
jgi:hypothetical protein